MWVAYGMGIDRLWGSLWFLLLFLRSSFLFSHLRFVTLETGSEADTFTYYPLTGSIWDETSLGYIMH